MFRQRAKAMGECGRSEEARVFLQGVANVP